MILPDIKPRKSYAKKKTVFMPADFVVLDVETTGLDPLTDRITELAAIRYRNGKRTEALTYLVNPDREIPDAVVSLTGITAEMVKDQPPVEKVLPLFLSFLGKDTLVGHNIDFDLRFITAAACRAKLKPPHNSTVDTLAITRQRYPDLPHHRLEDLARQLRIPQPESHRALADCETTAACYLQLRRA